MSNSAPPPGNGGAPEAPPSRAARRAAARTGSGRGSWLGGSSDATPADAAAPANDTAPANATADQRESTEQPWPYATAQAPQDYPDYPDPAGQQADEGEPSPYPFAVSEQDDQSYPDQGDPTAYPTGAIPKTRRSAPATGSQSLVRSSALMASGSFISRILGVVRASMILAIFANTTAGDAWQVANTLPTTVYMLLAGGVLNAVLVPQITKAEERGKDGEGFVDSLLTLSILGLALLTAICLPLAGLLVRLFASSTWPQAAFTLSTQFAVLCLPAVFFYGLYTILGQILNARGRFGAYMWAPVLCNIVWIVGLIVYNLQYKNLGRAITDWSPGMIQLMAGTMTFGVALQALILIWPLRRDGFRYRPRFVFCGIGLASAGKVATWVFAAVVVAQLGQVVTSQVVTSVSHGDVGRIGYDNAFLLFMTPHGLITVSLVTALFTSMTQAAQRGQSALLARDVRRGMRLIAITTIPVAVAMIALGTAGTRLLYPGNSIQATDAIAYVMWAMAFGLPAYGVYYLVQRAFFAEEDARTPFRLQLLNTAVGSLGALICYLLPSAYRAVGVGTAQATANVVTALVAVAWLRRRLGGLLLFDVVQTMIRTVVATIPAAVLAYAVFLAAEHLPSRFLGALIAVSVGGVLFVVTYVAMARRLHIRELDELISPVLARLRRARPAGEASV